MTPADRLLDAALYALPRVAEALRVVEEGSAGTDPTSTVGREAAVLRAALAEAASCIRRIVATVPARET